MKKAKLLSVIALTFIGSLFLFSCGKEEIPGPQGEQGIQGETGIGIESIEKSGSEGLVDIYTITFSDGTTSTFAVTNGKDGVDGTQGIQGIQGEPGEDGHTPVITIQEGYWYIDGENTNVLAEGIKGDTGNGISSIEKTNTEGLVDTYTITFTDGTTSTFTLTNGKDGVDGKQGIQGIQGVPGKDGHTPVITIENGYWHIDGVSTIQEAQGVKGETGNGISSITKTSTEGLVDVYTITYTDGNTSLFTVTNGAKGDQGEQGIQGIQGVPGEDGHTPVITIQEGYWYIDGVSTLQAAQGVKGETGNGISSITKTNTSGLIDTYTITYTDGTTSTFTVTNGKDGVDGAQGIQGEPGKDGHTPVITIQNGYWYIDGVSTLQEAQGVKGDTGNGISSIIKTSTEGLVDTYTITYTDGSTSTFTVTNGKDGVDGAQGIQGIKGEKGEDGHTPVITIQNGYWYIDGVNTQQAAQGVKGDTGNGVSSIIKTSTSGLVDTYTITYTDGTTSTFIVTNGKDGEDGEQGIQGIQGVPGEDGHTPVITIQDGYWYIDGVNTLQLAQGPKGENGAGILSVEFNELGQLVITLTDGTVLEPVDLPKKEEHIHTFTEWESIKDPTCTQKGLTLRFCEECNYTETKYVDALGHSEEVVKNAILPTNTEDGLCEEIECSVCHEKLQEQTVLSAKGYEWMLEDNEIKILLIGNSYTEDASNCGQGVVDSQLYSIIQSMVGEDVKVTVGVLISGGKGMNWHATQAENDNSAYYFTTITTDTKKWATNQRKSMSSALSYTNWDMISLQPYSVNTSTGIESNSYPNETDSKYLHIKDSSEYLLDYIVKYAPQSEVYLYMHWAQTSAIEMNAALSKYNSMADFYPTILEYKGKTTGKRFSTLVPVGLSIQNARTTYLSLLAYNTTAYADKNLNYTTDAQIGLQRDGGHVSFNIGRYIAALTFGEQLIPNAIRAQSYTLPDIRITESIGELPKEYTTIAQQAVSYAINSWKEGNLQVTNIEGYEKDPTTLFAENFDEDLYVDFEITEENIEIYLEDYLPEDMVLENVALTKNEDVYEVEATVRFGYTTSKVDISFRYDIQDVIELQYDDYTSIIGNINADDTSVSLFDNECLELITVDNEQVFHAKDVGSMILKNNDTLYQVNVNKAKINLVLIMGQSNAGNHFEEATSDITNPLGTAYWWQYQTSTEPIDYTVPSKGFHAPLLAELYAQSLADGNPIKNVMLWHEGTTSLNGKSITSWVPSVGDTSKMSGVTTMVKNCLNYYESNSDKYEVVGKGMFWYQGESDVAMDPIKYTNLFMTMWDCLEDAGMEYAAFFRVRKGVAYNNGTNPTHEDLDYHMSLAAQLKMINDNDNFYLATSITENWTGDDSTVHTTDISKYITLMNEYSGSAEHVDEYGNKATYQDGKLTTTMYYLFGAKYVNYCHYAKFGAAIIGADAAYNIYHALYKNNVSMIQTNTSGKPEAKNLANPETHSSILVTDVSKNLAFRASCDSVGGTLNIKVTSNGEDITSDVISQNGNNYGTVDTSLLKNYENIEIIVEYLTIDQTMYTFTYDVTINEFSNLTFTAFGDSITYGADLIIGGRVENPYPTLVSNILGLKSYENKGVSGATLCSNNLNLTCMTDVITSYTSETDIIGVLGGVNDFNRELPLGDIDDTGTSTIYGSLHVSMSYLSENYSDAFVFYMTPYKEYFHGVLWSDDNSQGYNLQDVANAIKEVAEIYNIPVLDLLELGGFEDVMYDEDCDGIHPNQNFITNVMAPQIAKFIQDNYQ